MICSLYCLKPSTWSLDSEVRTPVLCIWSMECGTYGNCVEETDNNSAGPLITSQEFQFLSCHHPTLAVINIIDLRSPLEASRSWILSFIADVDRSIWRIHLEHDWDTDQRQAKKSMGYRCSIYDGGGGSGLISLEQRLGEWRACERGSNFYFGISFIWIGCGSGALTLKPSIGAYSFKYSFSWTASCAASWPRLSLFWYNGILSIILINICMFSPSSYTGLNYELMEPS